MRNTQCSALRLYIRTQTNEAGDVQSTSQPSPPCARRLLRKGRLGHRVRQRPLVLGQRFEKRNDCAPNRTKQARTMSSLVFGSQITSNYLKPCRSCRHCKAERMTPKSLFSRRGNLYPGNCPAGGKCQYLHNDASSVAATSGDRGGADT